MVMPWPLTRCRPWSMTKAGRQCIWMSGVATAALERTNMPGLADAGGDRPGAVEQVLQADGEGLVSGRSDCVVADRRRLRGQVDVHVVLQVLADAGQVVHDRDAELAQLGAGPDARQQQQPGRVDRAAARRRPRALAQAVGRLALDRVLDADGAAVLDQDLCAEGVR